MSARPHSPLGPRDYGAVGLINLTWGFNIVAIKLAVAAAPPFAAGGLRQLIVLAVCLPFLRIVPGRMCALLTLAVLSGGLYLMPINLALSLSDNVPALAIAGQLGVPFALILGILFHRERIALPRLFGIVLAFGGVVMLVFDPAVADEVPGLLLTALAALIWAIGSLLQRQLAGVPVLTIYAWIGLLGAAVLLPLSLVVEPGALAGLAALPLRDFGWIAFSAIGSTIVGQGGMAWLLQRHPISVVVPMTLPVPVISVACSSLMFGTVLTPPMIAGGIIALTGVAIITFRTARPRETPAP